MKPVVETTSTHTDMLSLNKKLPNIKKSPNVLSMVLHTEGDAIILKVYQNLMPIGVEYIGKNSKIVHMDI